jgi:[ribosomal protein S5]-alanine N-acetyltransferase
VSFQPLNISELPIRTSRLELRDLVVEDFESIHRYASDPQVTRYLAWGPNTEAETRSFLLRAQAHAVLRPRRDFELGVIDRVSGELIGGCGLHSRREPSREYETGYCLRRDWWGKGVGSETVRALVDFGFRKIGAHRIYAQVSPGNDASARILERLGFRLEGHLRRDEFVRQEWHDTLLYAVLEEEWRSHPPTLA